MIAHAFVDRELNLAIENATTCPICDKFMASDTQDLYILEYGWSTILIHKNCINDKYITDCIILEG